METITKEDTLIIKGIAIVLVIIAHLGQVLHISMLNPLGSTGVCLFLFISGYGLGRSFERNGRNQYLTKRAIKVLIPYISSVCLFLVWQLIIHNSINWRTILQYICLIDLPQGSFWYLRLLLYWYVVFYFLSYVYEKEKLLLVCMCIASFAVIFFNDLNRLYVWQFASFPIGIIACKRKNELNKVLDIISRGGGYGSLFVQS